MIKLKASKFAEALFSSLKTSGFFRTPDSELFDNPERFIVLRNEEMLTLLVESFNGGFQYFRKHEEQKKPESTETPDLSELKRVIRDLFPMASFGQICLQKDATFKKDWAEKISAAKTVADRIFKEEPLVSIYKEGENNEKDQIAGTC